jgi:cell division protein FtsB
MMLDFQQKRKVRSFMYNRITIGFLSVIILLVLHSTWVVYRKKVESERVKQNSLKNVESLRARDQELQEKIDRLSTKQGIEEEVRLKFSVAKDDENIVIIVQDETASTGEKIKKQGLWDRIKSVFR